LAKTGLLQLYPPYKNLVPEIPKVGKEKVTRTTPVFNELVDTMIIFLKKLIHDTMKKLIPNNMKNSSLCFLYPKGKRE
jgi:hypothetical protein